MKKAIMPEAAAVALPEKMVWLMRVKSEYLVVWYWVVQAVIERVGVPINPMKPQR